MKILKLYLIIISSIVFTFLGIQVVNAQESHGFGSKIGIGGIQVPGTADDQGDSLLHTIQKSINIVLGFLSLIALILCLYAGFKMLISGGDSKAYSAGFSILKNAAIGLAIIGVSWLIVSIVFRFINGSIDLNVGNTNTSEVL